MSGHDHTRVQEFFGSRAAGWDDRFADDLPRYTAATHELALRPGDAVLDAGCGTGRALPPLRERVGPAGTVLGADLTPEMLGEARRRGRDRAALLLLADVSRLPLSDGALDAVFAAGLIAHLPEPVAGLRELARVVRPDGRLVLFHPLGRAALAARQGRRPGPGDLRARPHLTALLSAAGWHLLTYVDEDERFLAVSRRSTEAEADAGADADAGAGAGADSADKDGAEGRGSRTGTEETA
ncbi:methyltransferase domain-containing protein [Streptomyces sp. NPDC049954]|uniref:class I SAM-dependent methyltransferase n=1 Tax=Streptomyces sp. NPDC049954 TaxID=3155779 RepID=UPI00343DD874